jgi:hypothetical protein
MSFQPITGSGKVGFTEQGMDQILRSINAMQEDLPRTKTEVHRDAATFFVFKAKEKVHVVSGRLGRSIKVDSITPERAIVSANTKYAKIEEDRKGKRRLPPHTPHAYMHPSAIETGQNMPRWMKIRFDAMFARHRSP